MHRTYEQDNNHINSSLLIHGTYLHIDEATESTCLSIDWLPT